MALVEHRSALEKWHELLHLSINHNFQDGSVSFSTLYPEITLH
jgi:hypothetical protein